MRAVGKISANDRMERYRERKRQAGLRPVQLWVPDTRVPGFAEEVRHQCERINKVDEQEGIMDWLEGVSLLDEDSEETHAKGEDAPW